MELKTQLDEGILIHNKKQKPWRSNIWTQFHEIQEAATKNKIEFYFFCIDCEQVVANCATDGNTNAFRRHICYNKEISQVAGDSKSFLIKQRDKNDLKLAAVKLVTKDLRPYYAIEREGLIALCYASMIFGQHYPKANKSHLVEALPTRNTVRSAVCQTAEENRQKIRTLLKAAKSNGGIAATSDTWTDGFKHLTYICVVVHINVVEDDGIRYHRFILNVSEITELVKSAKVIVGKNKIYS